MYSYTNTRQNHEVGGSKTFCAISDDEPNKVLGFYSLARTSIGHARLGAFVTKGLPLHDVGGFKLARLAIHRDLQRQELGGQLLVAAAKRCLRVAAEVGGVILIIDAKSEQAAAWYETYEAKRLQDNPLTLVLSLKTIQTPLAAAGKG